MSTTVDFTERQSKLSPARQALLEKWKRGEVSIEQPKIPRRPAQGPVPLSFAQQRLWFIDQLAPGSPAYVVPHVLQLMGPLDVQVLARCIHEIVRRHESLRTTFPAVDGQPTQVIAAELSLPVPLIDLQEYPETRRMAQALRLAEADELVPFDLAHGPLARITVLRLSMEEHWLFLTAHHIVCDAWSASAFTRELSALYRAFAAGQPSPLPELPIQYADYAYWQQERLSANGLEGQLAYWKKQLAGVSPLLELPRDRPRPAIQNLQGASEIFELSPALSQALKVLSQQEGATLFMTLLAAFQALLYRYTGEADIPVGSAVGNREQTELQGLVGFLVNTLVLRTDLSGDPTFRELLNRVREMTLGAYANRDLPFEQLVEEMRPERDLSRNPLFQVMFTFLNMPPLEQTIGDLKIGRLPSRKEVALFDMVLVMGETEGRLAGEVEYSTGLFDAATIRRMLKHFETLLEGVVARPDQRLSELPILTEVELRQLLIDWNDTRADYPDDIRLHELVEAQAERTPNAVALIFEHQQLTYAELNARANQLAHYLHRLGVQPDTPVAVCMERSVEMVVGLLGILKAGGAYLPIDPCDPPERVLSVLDDSRASILLTQSHSVKGIPFTWLQNPQDIGQDICVTQFRPQIKNLDSLPILDRGLVDYGIYNRHSSASGFVRNNIDLIASRGCPYRCSYCHKVWPKTHIFRSAEHVFEEVQRRYDEGYRTFTFLDDIFNLNRRNSEAFFEMVLKRNMKLRILFTNGLRSDILAPDYIDLMSEAGTMQMSMVLETASPRLQKLISKNLKIDKVRQNIEYVCRKHPHIILDLLTMFGFPTETEEEALSTLDFIKDIQWLHFPYLSALKIFPNTDMASFAMEHGITKEAIWRSTHLQYHELGGTLPFSKKFAREYQSSMLNEYFLLPERLQSVIAVQKRVLTREEVISKYNNYMPGSLESYPEIIRMIGTEGFYVEEAQPRENGARHPRPPRSIGKQADGVTSEVDGELRILLIDLSSYFSHEQTALFNVMVAPLGLMHLLTYLDREFGDKVQGKIIKSLIDFDSLEELKRLIDDFKPQLIGIRTLSLFKDFFHSTVSLIRQWLPDIPIITGGPYATSEYETILADRNIDAVVLGEGEVTFTELVSQILAHGGRLPDADVLRQIAGLAFVPRSIADQQPSSCRQVLLMDHLGEILDQEETDNPARTTQPGDMAYVIYTSGSTGKPKGVINTHQGIVNRLLWMQATYGLNETDRVLQKTPYTFDVSVWEFFWPLLAGATLVAARPEGHKDNAYLAQLIAERKITTLHFVPSMLQAFLEEKDIGRCTSLRQVMCSGEALPAALQDRFFERLGAELHNLYGPTEAAVDVTYWACQRDSSQLAVPIGRPIANTQIHLLDRYLNPVPVGVPGELYIGGVGLARGYLNRPDLTAERFVPNPFVRNGHTGQMESGNGQAAHVNSQAACLRLYKTGDLARYLPDGRIEFLRRLDFQVKVRGLRIELGEIEAALRQHPSLLDAIVLTHADEHEPEHKQLVAYVIPQDQGRTGAERIPGVELSAEQIQEWQSVFNQAYSQPVVEDDPTLNLAGWVSSYTGVPIPAQQMHEWVDFTVKRILALQPRRVLEIGCGTGLLLLRLAPHCAEYCGIDFSQAALRYVEEHIGQPGRELTGVTLLHKAADDLVDVGAETVDVVILNSVVQYFPSIEYLLDVLKQAATKVASGGFIFVGDVRALPLLEAFHTSVELERAPSSLSTSRLRERVQKRMNQEQELVVDPAFFSALQHELPQISHVELQLKRGWSDNELTRFRYDVILHVGRPIQYVDRVPWLDWQDKGLTLDMLRQRLLETEPEILGLTHIPNARLWVAARARAWLRDLNAPKTVGELWQALRETSPTATVKPESIWALIDDLPYRVDIRWPSDGEAGCFDVLLRRTTAPTSQLAATSAWPGADEARQPWPAYANNPLREKFVHRLTPELQHYLKQKLPDYMIPPTFILMDSWPLTANGKLDRHALPTPLRAMPEMEGGFVAPRTPSEQIFASIWAQVLGLEKVGVNDNFFELGGDSIRSIRVVARANKLGFRLTPQQFFQNQTIAELVAIAGPVPIKPDDQAAAVSSEFLVDASDRQKVEQSLGAAEVEDLYPLAPFQEHMLYHFLSSPERGLYLVQRVDTLKGMRLNLPALERAWQRLTERHAILRTSFFWEGVSEPLQVVHAKTTHAVDYRDWRGLSQSEQTARLAAYLEADQDRGVELNRPVGVRVLLAQLTDDCYHMVQSFSYLCMDGWTFGLLGAELLTLYGAFCTGQNLQIGKGRPYRDFIAWYKRQDLSEARAFWQRALRGFTAPTPLVDHAPGNQCTEEAGVDHLQAWLPASLVTRLQSLVQRHRLVANTLIQAAWSLLLSRYTGQDDVVFGVAMTGRPATLIGVEDIAGPSLNILPLRVPILRERFLLPWLEELMARQVELSQYAHTPLRKLHEWGIVPADVRPFESYLVFQNLSLASLSREDVGPFFVNTGEPLRVDVLPGRELGLILSYYRRCFDADTISRIVQDFQNVLEGIVSNPEQCLGDLMALIASA